MTTTKTVQEDKLLVAARLMDEEELSALTDFVNKMLQTKEKKEPTNTDKEDFKCFLEGLRNKAAEKGLTPEILERILAQND